MTLINSPFTLQYTVKQSAIQMVNSSHSQDENGFHENYIHVLK